MSPQPAPVTTTATPATTATTQASTQPAQTNTTSTPVSTPTSTLITPAQKDSKIETFDATTKDFHTKFTNQSGTISSIELLNYYKTLKEKSEATKQFNVADKKSDSVSVVPFAQPTRSPLLWNLAFRTSPSNAPQVVLNDQNVNYAWQDKSPTQISFSTLASPGIKVQRFYRFGKDPYVIEHVLRVENTTKDSFYVDADTSISSTHVLDSEKKGSFLSPQNPDVQATAFVNEKDNHWKLNDLSDKDAQISTPPISWAGFSSQYFLLTAIPTEGMWNGFKGNFENNVGTVTMNYSQRTLAPNSNIEYALKLYAGPKQMDVLQVVHPTLDHAIDLGSWIGGLARMIHKLLVWIYGFLPNYGWAIIILTVMVRLAVFPLAQMQAKSMKRMTAHKPAMDALKVKYGNDREAYSRELMSYMRTNKINPASGCLPLLIQFPVFIALYRVLYNSIELRHAPFGLWIHDLSSHDPFFVLPVLVGITFYLQTKLNPTPMADPAQQTMMKIMPVMFSVFMIFLPSGLNLYIFVSTLWGIVQQYVVNYDAPVVGAST